MEISCVHHALVFGSCGKGGRKTRPQPNPTQSYGLRVAFLLQGKVRHAPRDALFWTREARHGRRDALFLTRKAHHGPRVAFLL